MTKTSSTDSAREARRCALRLIARRDRSPKELRQRLAGKGFTPDQVNQTVEWLVSRKLLDETAMAQRLVQRAKRDRLVGRRGTRAWLSRFGIEGTAAEEALDGYPVDEEIGVARALLEKKGPKGEDAKTRARVRRFLQGRGFHPETVAAVMRNED